MPGTKKPNREHSRQGSFQHKHKQQREELKNLKLQFAKYVGAVHELGVNASKSAARVGMLTKVVVTCRKHFSMEPHFETCTKEPCDCGKQAILDSIDKALAEPDFDPGNVSIEIKETQPESVPLPVLAPDTMAGVNDIAEEEYEASAYSDGI